MACWGFKSRSFLTAWGVGVYRILCKKIFSAAKWGGGGEAVHALVALRGLGQGGPLCSPHMEDTQSNDFRGGKASCVNPWSGYLLEKDHTTTLKQLVGFDHMDKTMNFYTALTQLLSVIYALNY